MSATNVQDAIDENASIGNQALAIAKGRNQSLAYNSYSEMVTALNGMSKDELKRGQNIYIGTVGVPDLWVYSVETNIVTYSYVNDETIVNSLGTDTTIQVGYYILAQLETQKVDLTNIESEIDDLQTSDTDINALITALTNRVTELENASSGGNEWTYIGELTSSNWNSVFVTVPETAKKILVTCRVSGDEYQERIIDLTNGIAYPDNSIIVHFFYGNTTQPSVIIKYDNSTNKVTIKQNFTNFDKLKNNYQ